MKFPDGEPAPSDGSLPRQVTRGADSRSFSAYIHVPYCRVRCGYCDFNTYTAQELGTTSQLRYADEACAEIRLAGEVMRDAELPQRELRSVFFGGGTPTLLPAADLIKMLDTARHTWGIAPGAEITTEANPDSVDTAYLAELKAAGFTRVSFGMQSAVPHVLKALDRTHRPESVPQVVAAAKELGLETSVDLIFGAPGESLADWETTVRAALALEPDHISAYALIIEDGTKLALDIRRGRVAAPDDDLQADMYELADAAFTAAGMQWYEISNWSRSEATRSTHNLAYWTGEDWWGVGPGAHSHIGGVRWWNVKHPRAYSDRLRAGLSPVFEREVLDAATRREERILLETRIRDGLDLGVLSAQQRRAVSELIGEGMVDGRAALTEKRLVPTLRGRLLADTVIHRLLSANELDQNALN